MPSGIVWGLVVGGLLRAMPPGIKHQGAQMAEGNGLCPNAYAVGWIWLCVRQMNAARWNGCGQGRTQVKPAAESAQQLLDRNYARISLQ